ncbi:RagB/SusD family nutrient uptake outer membrane protein [Cyclobacterium plantarum]|uniref:RagB/SusD family nutrient uptake outer membrane protein n=1 Tax=Cyclobacterium plantarum TaxID=2716263 RepID=A0ABX0HIK9_9BACT|nr:RagB/SusD family nutrient uptake outer membrane protein [Cyclobacterium plantarum]NHE59900.1 RagB/SusD family nutrient uptake outer membrane protein [Cyclobacterium plantarum]
MNNKWIIIIVLLSGIFSTSCEDYLEEDLISGVSAGTYYTTASGFEAAVAATYAETKSFYGWERGFTMTVFGTDLHTNGRGGSHKMINFYDGAFSPAQGFVRDTWRDFYRGINQANAVINRSENVNGVSEAMKTARIAEVRFLRALFYFNLVRFFGDVHLSLEETVGVEIEANRTPAGQIYSEAIIPDLEFAISNLPDAQNDYGRVSKPAAEFLLAKVMMTRAYQSYGQGNADAQEAERLMGNVINNYNFNLLPDFANLWDINNERNSEIIFSIQNNKNQVDEGLDTRGHSGHLYFLMEYDILPGMARDTENGRPWIRFRPTDFLLGLWDRDMDARYDKTYKHAWISNTESSIPEWTAEDANQGYVAPNLVGTKKYSIGDTAVFIPGPGKDELWTEDRIGRTPYLVITNSQYDERWYPTLNKWIDPTRPNRQHPPGQRDHPLMRLADAYLIRAEARIMLGDQEGAAEDINSIRRRGAWPGMESAIEIAAGEATLDFLLDERGRELVGEGHRWFDLARTGKLVERVRAHNPEGRNNIQDYHIFRPIPLEQIDRTSGGYQQNCGYIGADC